MKQLFSYLLILIFSIASSFAITASSSSYSVNSFGNGVVSADASSPNYAVTFLGENKGTTSNLDSFSFRGNLGFFESSYSSSISITSYSVNPSSAVVGSTISFSINALNANQVWVKITPPNSQEYTLNLINGGTVNHLPIPSVVGVYQVVFYAESSSGAISSVVSSFELTAQNVVAPSSGSAGSSGGGSSGRVNQCTYVWDCTPWSVCVDGLQNRLCTNTGTCSGVQGKPAEQVQCSESLFDVSINLDNLVLNDKIISFDVSLTELLNSDEIGVHVKYSIIDSNNNEIFSQIETRAVNDELTYTKSLDVLNLVDGNYKLRVDVLYGNLQRAFAEQSFIYGSPNPSGITGFAGEEILGSNINLLAIGLGIIVLLVSALIYLTVSRKKIKVSNYNSVVGLDGLDVYTDSGLKLGRVYDVMLVENRIYGLMIVADKDAGLSHPKVLIRYEYIQNIKDAVIVNAVVTESGNHSNG